MIVTYLLPLEKLNVANFMTHNRIKMRRKVPSHARLSVFIIVRMAVKSLNQRLLGSNLLHSLGNELNLLRIQVG